MVAFWATPTMSARHLLFATYLTAYMLVAIPIEERDLAEVYGEPYEQYRTSSSGDRCRRWSRGR
jgi:methanethiol S-methyltransferase